MTDEQGPSLEDSLRFRVKAELRKRMRAVRRTTPEDACAERSRKIVARLLARPELASPARVALFWPITSRHEVDLRPLDATLRARGVRIAYPAIDPDTHTMTFRFVDDLGALEERGMGFEEPAAAAEEARELDAIVVPALAVDAAGYRIGYGAGYYDRTLPRFAPPAKTVAVIYDWELVVDVPFTEHDVRVGAVVTDARAFDVPA